MKSTPTEALKSEDNIVPRDLSFEELQRMEATKSIYHQQHGKKVSSKKSTSSTHLVTKPKNFLKSCLNIKKTILMPL